MKNEFKVLSFEGNSKDYKTEKPSFYIKIPHIQKGANLRVFKKLAILYLWCKNYCKLNILTGIFQNFGAQTLNYNIAKQQIL